MLVLQSKLIDEKSRMGFNAIYDDLAQWLTFWATYTI